MNLIERATIISYHRHRIATYQDGTVEALGWRGPESQLKRFEAICRVGDLSGSSLLDVGCGYGDLKGYLDGRFTGFTYIGIDQMPEFIAEARNRYAGCPNTRFFQTDFTRVEFPRVDYVIASGALAYRCDNPDFCTDMIRKMFEASDRAAAFNLLDAGRFPEHPLLVGRDRNQIMSFCQGVSPRVELVSGYLEDDFTVFMYQRPIPAG